jgi:hypothetical protein
MIKTAKKKQGKSTSASQTYVDFTAMGKEPILSSEATQTELIRVLNWYNYMIEPKTTIDYLVDYLRPLNVKLSDYVKTLHQYDVSLSHSRLARIITLSPNAPVYLKTKLNTYIETLKVSMKNDVKRPVEEIKDNTPKVVNKTDIFIAEIETLIDKMAPFSLYDYLKTNEVPKYVVPNIITKYEPLLTEIQAAYDKEDQDLVQAYKCYSRKELKEFLERIVTLIDDANRFIDNKNKARKVRKKKAPSKDTVLKLFKPLAAYDPLKIVSVSSELVLESTELYTYNIRYKILNHYIAKPETKLSVHRTSITNYDEDKSRSKRVGRKEKEILDFLLKSGKVQSRKVFDLATTEFADISDRVSDQVILLKAYK